MTADTGIHSGEAAYAAYVEHLMACGECGLAPCPAGADLCNRCLELVNRSWPVHRDGHEHYVRR
ncbi:hypothetical protein AB0E77_30235 [Streptomyces sp. NPDC032940]|uniref:hypothetical protein n=1 Tax=Streptomyces sp. NPDC032940 TaxID=3155366 RepID=UPI003404AD76